MKLIRIINLNYLIRTLFLIMLCLFSGVAIGSNEVSYYLTMRRALADIESGNDPAARNPKSTASGKYQFVKSWNPYFKKRAGYTWTSTVPKRGASKTVRDKASERQDFLFDLYFNEIVSPWIINVRTRYLAARKLSHAELLALVHRQGGEAGEKYLKSGIDPYSGKYGNKHIATHLRAMRRQMAFYSYLDTQHELVKRR